MDRDERQPDSASNARSDIDSENEMANDAEWVQDVRRWYFGGHPPEGESSTDVNDGGDELAVGYEAAIPRLQVKSWPDALIAGDL